MGKEKYRDGDYLLLESGYSVVVITVDQQRCFLSPHARKTKDVGTAWTCSTRTQFIGTIYSSFYGWNQTAGPPEPVIRRLTYMDTFLPQHQWAREALKPPVTLVSLWYDAL